ncbi:MAG: UDP-N-acetylglucosamine 2-epimerase (non-hydrolyzing) [Bacteroidales bacterium]|nr:UDP-N-acetylglucosamine 2-epimerase (non-hydrolyzing) [Bacteroidales bacterium]MDT8374735.1 UDP-N-acetylglucosamine 2-epimerase (non-hydrolyzing) [Bacteroidales bacterium]
MFLDLIVGARPNFMKIAPIIREIERRGDQGNTIKYRLVHTGQHYDRNMSGSFFEELGIPEPHVNLNIGSGTQAEQTSGIMTGYEKLLMQQKPDLCIVVGDVTSTMACAIAAKKLLVKVAHVEGGIRSDDMTMPEEINRIVTDSITDYFFTTSETANANLRRNGVSNDRIFFVGNTMIDTLLFARNRFRKPSLWDELDLKDRNYIVLTLHRPNNVDDPVNLRWLLDEIINSSKGLPIIFPVHPRTRKIINSFSESLSSTVSMADPLGYLEFNYLVERSLAVITDSGGITEETTVMGVPCMTLRDSTERPETVTMGTNELLGTNPDAIAPAMQKLLSDQWKKGSIPPLWDGHTSERIIEIISKLSL